MNPLKTERGRQENIPADQRFCKYCITHDLYCIEDEYHFLAICSFYKDLRKEMLPRWFCLNPSYDKFISLLNSDNLTYLNNLASFIYFAMKNREEFPSMN